MCYTTSSSFFKMIKPMHNILVNCAMSVCYQLLYYSRTAHSSSSTIHPSLQSPVSRQFVLIVLFLFLLFFCMTESHSLQNFRIYKTILLSIVLQSWKQNGFVNSANNSIRSYRKIIIRLKQLAAKLSTEESDGWWRMMNKKSKNTTIVDSKLTLRTPT